jgi:hypothetical protein
MKLTVALLLGLSICYRVLAAPEVYCANNPGLDQLEGYWAQPKFIEVLKRTRSWSAAVDEHIFSVHIRRRLVMLNFNWHEGSIGPDPDPHCVRLDGKTLWVSSDGHTWDGPFIFLGAGSDKDEAAYYLKHFFQGCFKSEIGEQWCLSHRGINVNGKRLPARLQKDIAIETPHYGTPFLVEGRSPPFLVFIPRRDGWAIFETDWTNEEGYPDPHNPPNSIPWRTLGK